MDYKQKYEEALEKAKNELEACDSKDCDVARQIFRLFPVLKEAKDEKIRKSIVETVKNYGPMYANPQLFQEMLAWLEKQGEHKKFRDSIQVNDQVTKNEDGVLVNLSQLKRVAKQGEKKPTKWSEEDEWMLIEVLITVHDKINYVGTDKKAISSITEQISWLKSLKKRMKGE